MKRVVKKDDKEFPWHVVEGYAVVEETKDGDYVMKRGSRGSTVISRDANGTFIMPTNSEVEALIRR